MLLVRRFVQVVAMSTLLFGGAANAFDFDLTDAEWTAWPEFCRARFAVTNIGSVSKYARMVPPETIARWKTELGPGWDGVHHFCAGMAYYNRAIATGDKKMQAWNLERSIDEFAYFERNAPVDAPLYSEMLARKALAYNRAGDQSAALSYAAQAISTRPAYDGGYIAKATIEKRLGRTTAARDSLLDGLKATDGQSAELRYNLGLVYFDLKNYEAAREQAKAAYGLGYPLPGLRNKLARVGYPVG